MITAFIHGFILALGLILPLGAQNVFVFSQGALHAKFYRAIPVIIATSLADTLLILFAILGVSSIVLTLPWLKTILVVFGVLFLVYIGFVTWRNKDDQKDDSENSKDWSLKRRIFFALSVSLLNPHAILDTIGVIGTTSLSYSSNAKACFAFATILLSWVWFFALAFSGRLVGKIKKVRSLLNKISAIIMWLCCIYLIVNNF